MYITEYSSLKSSRGKVIEVSFDEIARKLSVTKKIDYTREQYLKFDSETQKELKSSAGGAVWGKSLDGSRKKASIPLRSAITLDYDDAPRSIIDITRNALKDISYVLYSTIKSTAEAPRVRIIIPLSREVDADEMQAAGRAVIQMITTQGIDQTTLQQSRMMLYPATLSDQHFLYDCNQANVLDVDKFLAEKYRDWKDQSSWWLFENEKRSHISTQKKAAYAKENRATITVNDPRNKKNIVGYFCQAYTVSKAIETFLTDVYEAGTVENRYTLRGHSANGLVVYDDLYALACNASDKAENGGHAITAYDLVRIHLFSHLDNADREYKDIMRMPSCVAMENFARADNKVKMLILSDQAAKYESNVTDKRLIELAYDRGHSMKDTYRYNDDETAKRICDLFDNVIKYDADTAVWYEFDGVTWNKVKVEQIYKYVVTTANVTLECFCRNNVAIKEEDLRYADYCKSSRGIKSIIECLKAKLYVNANDFDADDYKINLQDCYYDLTTHTSEKHQANHLCRNVAGANLSESFDADCIKFIEEVLPDTEVRDYVQRLCGYVLAAGNAEQKLFFLHGPRGNNGKSTFTSLLEHALGDYASTGQIDSLLTAKNDGDPERANPSIARLRGARLVLMHENDQHRSIRSAAVKRITGNTAIVARNLNENFAEFLPGFTALIDVNDLPSLQDAGDDAMKKRIRVIPFTAHFSNPDRSLVEKVKTAEWKNAFMHWAIAGYEAYCERGLDNFDGSIELRDSNLPAAMKKTMSEYFESSDDVGEFVTSCVENSLNTSAFVTISDLYTEYERWTALTPRSRQIFAKQVKDRISRTFNIEQTRERKHGQLQRGYAGLRLTYESPYA